MRSGSVLVATLGCTWCACLDTKPDRAGPSAQRDLAFAAWDAGAGSEKPALAQPTGGRSAQASGGAAQARSKPQQPAAAGAAGLAESSARKQGSAGSAGAPLPPQSPAVPAPERPGDLIISELMIDPKALPDADGEWLELYNASAGALELRDCALDDGGKSLHALAPTLHVAAGGYFTLARSAAPGFKPDTTLALSLSNDADSVAIVCRGIEIDRVSYDRSVDFVIKPGVSMALDPSQLDDPQHNDVASAWCEGRDAFSTDFGSPGRANPSCHMGDEWDDVDEAEPAEAEEYDAGAGEAEGD